MNIETDFIPKVGDRVRQKTSSGRLGVFTWVICPNCFKGRWIEGRRVTNKCQDCYFLSIPNWSHSLLWSEKAHNRIERRCSRCGKLKPLTEFYRSNATCDGRSCYCKTCHQEANLTTGGRRYFGLHKRSFPLDNKCELCGEELIRYGYHHWDDNNPNLGIWVCHFCDFFIEGLDEIGRNPFKVAIYHRLKDEMEEVEKVYVYLGPFSPSNGIHRLFLDGEQTHKFCPHCGKMKPVSEFYIQSRRNDGLYAWCKECKGSFRLRSHGKRFDGLHKRPKPDCCELCGDSETIRLDYHHWDGQNHNKGVWVCHKNKCHQLAEAIDKISKNGSLKEKYLKLRAGINKEV